MLLEITANAALAVSAVLAGRNSIHTWWTGAIACALFALLYARTQLYASVALQLFLIATCAVGWWRWRRHELQPVRELGRGKPVYLWAAAATGGLAALAYGTMLSRTTDAHAPFADSLVLMFSVIAQLLQMRRRVESWWFWIAVNLVAVPLYFSRGLYPTSLLYVGLLANAILALRHWQALHARPHESARA